MTPSNIHYIFNAQHHGDKLQRRLVAKFALKDGHFELLENHGLPEDFDGMSEEDQARIIQRYSHSMYYEMYSLQDLLDGYGPMQTHQDAATDENDLRVVLGNAAVDPKGPDEYQYERIGGNGPQTLTIHGSKGWIDGLELEPDEIQAIKDSVAQGKAYLRRGQSLNKSIFNQGYEQQPQQSKVLNNPIDRHMNESSIVPGAGNLSAYKKFSAQNKPGMHIKININSMRHLNKQHGPDIGNKAIAAIGQAIVQNARLHGGQNTPVFHEGGDRFVVHMPDSDSALTFARGLRSHLDSIPAFLGTHRPSVTMGIGPSSDHAKWGLLTANEQRNQTGAGEGQHRTHIAYKSSSGDKEV